MTDIADEQIDQAFDVSCQHLPDQSLPVSFYHALGWLTRLHDRTHGDGVAAYTFPFIGIAKPYPETTGYIIPTLLTIAHHLEDEDSYQRAMLMGEWLLTIQAPDGSFPAKRWSPNKQQPPSVFNSGQILFGLLALFAKTGEARWERASHACAMWLCRLQEADGAWRRHTYRGEMHAYTTRVAWALILCGQSLGDDFYVECGKRNLDFALQQQTESGWFHASGFTQARDPFLHTFAYTVRGLLESGILLDEQQYIFAAAKSAHQLLSIQGAKGALPGVITPSFSPKSHRCLTGIAQTSIIWSRLHDIGYPCLHEAPEPLVLTDTEGEPVKRTAWQQAANKAIDYLEGQQVKASWRPNCGAFAGSAPFWGPYMRCRYPNWGVKFFLDAVAAQQGWMRLLAWG